MQPHGTQPLRAERKTETAKDKEAPGFDGGSSLLRGDHLGDEVDDGAGRLVGVHLGKEVADVVGCASLFARHEPEQPGKNGVNVGAAESETYWVTC